MNQKGVKGPGFRRRKNKHVTKLVIRAMKNVKMEDNSNSNLLNGSIGLLGCQKYR